jgi:hypothetical protein
MTIAACWMPKLGRFTGSKQLALSTVGFNTRLLVPLKPMACVAPARVHDLVALVSYKPLVEGPEAELLSSMPVSAKEEAYSNHDQDIRQWSWH